MMKKVLLLWLLVFGVVGYQSTFVYADDLSELKEQMQIMKEQNEAMQRQLQEQNRQMQAIQQRIDELEKEGIAKGEVPKGIEERVVALEEKKGKESFILGELAKIDWYGDMRLRYEGTFNQDNAVNRHRERFRFRFGLKYPVTDELEFGTRVTTGTASDAGSPYVTLGDFFAKDAINLDRAYLRYHNENSLEIVGGKFSNVFWQTEATWDGDAQPEGGVVSYTFKDVPLFDSMTFHGGAYNVSELAADNDAWMGGGQMVFDKQLTPDWKANMGVAYYDFHKPSPIPTRDNAIDGAGSFISDFKDIDVITKLTYTGWKWPLSFLFDYAHNFGAASDVGDDLFWAEASLGKIKEIGDWEMTYEFARIQQDAVLADINQDDTSPETNMMRHGLYLTRRILKNTDLNLTYYFYKRLKLGSTAETDEETWSNRLRVNLTTKF